MGAQTLLKIKFIVHKYNQLWVTEDKMTWETIKREHVDASLELRLRSVSNSPPPPRD